MTRPLQALVASLVIAVVLVVPAAPVSALSTGGGGAPLVEHGQYADSLAPDDFFIDLCGIVTNTTVREVDTLKTWPDGSQSFHVERSFIPDDTTRRSAAREQRTSRQTAR